MSEIKNRGNRYQGQLKATSVDGERFQANHNYFTQIQQMTNGNLRYLQKVAIYWERPGNKNLRDKITLNQQTGQIEYDKIEEHPKPYVTLIPRDYPQQATSFEIGYNNIIQFRNTQIVGIIFSQDSNSRCFIDFIGHN